MVQEQGKKKAYLVPFTVRTVSQDVLEFSNIIYSLDMNYRDRFFFL